MVDRERVGREASPTAAVLDSQSVKTTESGRPRGYDAGKKVKGRKRQVMVDTDGRGLVLEPQPANVQDRDGACVVLCLSRRTFPFIIKAFADKRLDRRGSHPSDLNCHRDRQEATGSGWVRGASTQMGCGTVLRVDQQQPAALERFGGDTDLRLGIPLRCFRHAPRPPLRTVLMIYGTGSYSCK